MERLQVIKERKERDSEEIAEGGRLTKRLEATEAPSRPVKVHSMRWRC